MVEQFNPESLAKFKDKSYLPSWLEDKFREISMDGKYVDMSEVLTYITQLCEESGLDVPTPEEIEAVRSNDGEKADDDKIDFKAFHRECRLNFICLANKLGN
jgi:hypothetical protein